MRFLRLIHLGLIATYVYANSNGDSTHNDAVSPTMEFINGRRVEPLTVRGTIEPGGVEMTFKGTIQEIDKQIRNLNLNFSWQQFWPSKPDVSKLLNSKRTISKFRCHVQGLKPAKRDAIETNRDSLKNATVLLIANPGKCTTISCLANARVTFCNDSMLLAQKNSTTLAPHLDLILNSLDCATPGDNNLLQGQVFDTEKFNIIVSEATQSFYGENKSHFPTPELP
ncbi:hypothetical protein F4677DRAFT_450701 [Hypoxylon crocopeplum]|nr:hypothetical protein F4677DRAFT_450701 [Hypoxylon crocopeplum]